MSTDDPQDLAARLRKLKDDRGLSLSKISEMTGIPKASLQNYMKPDDGQKPGLEALVAIAQGLEVSIDWLAGLKKAENQYNVHEDTLRQVAYEVSFEYFQAISVSDKVPAARALVDGKFFGHKPIEFANSFSIDLVRKYMQYANAGITVQRGSSVSISPNE